MKDNFREILAQEFTPEKETNLIGVPPSVMELLAAKKRRLLDEEQARIDASNSALRDATNFIITLDPTLYTSKGCVISQFPDGWKFDLKPTEFCGYFGLKGLHQNFELSILQFTN